ncbi:type I restriction enzyme S subunit [Acidovorax sp. 106]|nr:type I restriction enzyme S subunit [Acidovorax sp. 106]
MTRNMTSLGEVAQFINGAAFKPEDWGDSGFPIIRIQNLTDESKPFNRTTRTVAEKLQVHPGDLLVSWSATLGVFTWNRPEIGLLNQHIFRVIPDESKVDKAYLRLALSGALSAMQKHLHGATMQHVNRGEFLGTPLYLPTLEEQRRIAAILDQAETLRTQRRTALTLLDSLTQSLFLDMFGDPVANPKGWKKTPFGNVCPTRLGKMLDAKQQTGQNTRRYLRNANVQWFHIDVTDLLEMDFDADARETFRLQAGDLLICEGGEPGRAAIWNGELEDVYYQKALHRGRPNPALAKAEFLVWLLWFLAKRGGLGDHVTAATIAHLTGEKLKAMEIPLPPLPLQQTFATRIASIEALKATHRRALAALDALFASLQQRAFAGQL